jgi:hypothetical protein
VTGRVPVRASAAAILASVSLCALPARAVDARAEASAKDALRKAGDDFDGKDYMTALARLDGAARACDVSRCSPMTKALVLRDLGTMQFRSGDAGAAARSFADALKIEPDLALRTKYDAKDVHVVWDRAKQGGAATRPAERPRPAEKPAAAMSRCPFTPSTPAARRPLASSYATGARK